MPANGGGPVRKHNRKDEIGSLAEGAVSCYKGHFLPADGGQMWTVSFRERLRRKYLDVIAGVCDYSGSVGGWDKAAEYCEKAIYADEHAEEFYRRLMLCHLHSGRRAQAISVYQRCSKILFASFGLRPDEKTEAVYKEIMKAR